MLLQADVGAQRFGLSFPPSHGDREAPRENQAFPSFLFCLHLPMCRHVLAWPLHFVPAKYSGTSRDGRVKPEDVARERRGALARKGANVVIVAFACAGAVEAHEHYVRPCQSEASLIAAIVSGSHWRSAGMCL